MKKIKNRVNIIFIAYIIIASIININTSIADGSFSFEGAEQASREQVLFAYAIFFVISIFVTLVKNIFVIVIFIAIKFGIKAANKDKLSKIDFGKSKEYYRDILKSYSPAVLSYIDDFSVENNKDIIATLLSLKMKRYIDITDNDIVLLNNSNTDNLDENEKYILSSVENKSTISVFEFNNKVVQDSKVHELIKFKIDIKKQIIKRIITLVVGVLLLMILMALSGNIIGNIYTENIFVILAIMLSFGSLILFTGIYPIFSIIFLMAYAARSATMPYIRTDKGNEINEKLEGLKNYLKDFSIMNERETEEIILWEDYLIYSVIFNQNIKVIQELVNNVKFKEMLQ